MFALSSRDGDFMHLLKLHTEAHLFRRFLVILQMPLLHSTTLLVEILSCGNISHHNVTL